LGDIQKFDLSSIKWGQLQPGTKIGAVEAVFPRADKSAVERMQQMEEQERSGVAVIEPKSSSEEKPLSSSPAAETSKSPAGVSAPTVDGGKISIDDFAKVELRVALVKVAERVPKADKLLRLEVDLGTETRQILAGIAESYTPESLVGRKVVIVANLAPRKMRGLESNGMVVAASPDGGKAVLAGFLEDVPVGTRLK
jgi:methionyl-tRNA synthetase